MSLRVSVNTFFFRVPNFEDTFEIDLGETPFSLLLLGEFGVLFVAGWESDFVGVFFVELGLLVGVVGDFGVLVGVVPFLLGDLAFLLGDLAFLIGDLALLLGEVVGIVPFLLIDFFLSFLYSCPGVYSKTLML